MKSKNIKLSKRLDYLHKEFALDVLAGLSARQKYLPCRYIYDERGSRLFSQIMDLPEYYLTGAEGDLLMARGSDIAGHLPGEFFNLIELGAGDGQKTRLIIQDVLNGMGQIRYIPIDISEEALMQCSAHISGEFPGIEITPLAADYFDGLQFISRQDEHTSVVLFLGSNIGNFSPPEGAVFLSKLKSSLKKGDYLFIGFDLKKDIEVMVAAYNDIDGVTAEFNKNLLMRINNELDGDFDLSAFKYFSTWDCRENAIVSSLISTEDQAVTIGFIDKTFYFHAWESIHTESSYKYTPDDIKNLARESGFTIVETFIDDPEYFAGSLWRVD